MTIQEINQMEKELSVLKTELAKYQILFTRESNLQQISP